MIVQTAYLDTAHKDFVKFCNDLRCPLCEAQLDGNINKNIADLYCASNNKEYKVHYYSFDLVNPDTEKIVFWYPQYEYNIDVHMVAGQYRTIISRYNADELEIYRYNTRKIMFTNYGSKISFFRKRMEEDVFLKKLKTYQTFV